MQERELLTYPPQEEHAVCEIVSHNRYDVLTAWTPDREQVEAWWSGWLKTNESFTPGGAFIIITRRPPLPPLDPA